MEYGILYVWYNEPYNEVVEMEIIGAVASRSEAVELATGRRKAINATVTSHRNIEDYSFMIARRASDGRYTITEHLEGI